jgi:UDPglucose 6-dehydrogenase
MRVTIIGIGWVGRAMQQLFPDAYIYSHGTKTTIGTKEEANKGDIAFICVPSPNYKTVLGASVSTLMTDLKTGINYDYLSQIGEGKLDTSRIEESVKWCECPLLVIRSTVNPGTCDYLSKKYNKHIVMQPEYLGETPAHPMLDQKTRQFIIIGGDREDTRKLIELYQSVYNANTNIRQVTAYEAEVIKLTENRAIAFKVAECQELYDVCERHNLDYYIIRDAVYGDDPRFNLWWTFIYPEKRGFNSKCIPKDIYAWCAWAESMNYDPSITRAILKKNREWIGK